VSAPAKAPYYWDFGTSEEGYPPAYGGPWYIDSMVGDAAVFEDWKIEGDGSPVVVWPITKYEETGTGKIGFGAKGVQGEIALTMDPSGWILAVATIAGKEVFRGFIDRPWEQYDIWPVGATPERNEEGPGRIGKKRAWVALSTEAWPQLLSYAGGSEALIVEIDENKLRENSRNSYES
jgi:hypothetical protein